MNLRQEKVAHLSKQDLQYVDNKMVKIGTRASKLALLQTELVEKKFKSIVNESEVSVVKITTGGDKNRKVPIANIGGTGVFVKELEEALLNKSVDFVVHSLKDMPTQSPDGLTIAAVLNREDPRDVLVSKKDKGYNFKSLPPGSKVATSSRRRLAQLKAVRKDLEYVDIRGNVPTRIEKMENGHCDAIILAASGLIRLELDFHISEILDNDVCVPAAGQGALAIQCRSDDEQLKAKLDHLNDENVKKEVTCERSFLSVLGGGCSVPVGASAKYNDDYQNLTITGCVAALDGSTVVKKKLSSDSDSPSELGVKLANLMLESPAKEILEELRASEPNLISPP